MHPALKSFTLGIVASTLAIAGCAVPTHMATVPATSVSARTASLGLRLHWGRQIQWVATDVTKVHLDIQVEGTTYHTQMDVTSTSDLVDVSGLPGGVASVTATAYVGSTAVGTSNGTIPLVLGARSYADLSITLDSAGTAALLLQTPLDATRLAPQPSNQAPLSQGAQVDRKYLDQYCPRNAPGSEWVYTMTDSNGASAVEYSEHVDALEGDIANLTITNGDEVWTATDSVEPSWDFAAPLIYLQDEDLTLPAGQFLGVHKFASAANTETEFKYFWIAPGIGRVKEIMGYADGDLQGTVTFELKSFVNGVQGGISSTGE